MENDIMGSDFSEETNTDDDYSEPSKSESIDSYDIFSDEVNVTKYRIKCSPRQNILGIKKQCIKFQ